MKNIIYLAIGFNQLNYDSHSADSVEVYSLTDVDFYNMAAQHMRNFALGNTELQLISYYARLPVGTPPDKKFSLPIEETHKVCDLGKLVVQYDPIRLEDLLITLNKDATVMEVRLTRDPI